MADPDRHHPTPVAETGVGPPDRVTQSAWAWSDPGAEAAVRSRQLGPILRAYRRSAALSQAELAVRLGYDKSYISMLENGRRTVQDVATRRHLSQVLRLPAHLLGVTEPADTDHVAMVAFAESMVRLAELARAAGRAGDAIPELWTLVARLEARAADGQLEPATLGVLGRARISLGVCLGTVLPEERLGVATRCTAAGLTATRQLPAGRARTAQLHLALAMHGNELHKTGRTAEAVSLLQEADEVAPTEADRGAALALLARAAGQAGAAGLYATTARRLDRLIEAIGSSDGERDVGLGRSLIDPFAWREIRMRAQWQLGNTAAAVRLQEQVVGPAPAPQWHVIDQVTTAIVLLAGGAPGPAEAVLVTAVDGARRHRLPHQLQRAVRVAEHAGRDEVSYYARAALDGVLAEAALGPGR